MWLNHCSRRVVVSTLSNEYWAILKAIRTSCQTGRTKIFVFFACCVKKAYKYKIPIKIVDFC